MDRGIAAPRSPAQCCCHVHLAAIPRTMYSPLSVGTLEVKWILRGEEECPSIQPGVLFAQLQTSELALHIPASTGCGQQQALPS